MTYIAEKANNKVKVSLAKIDWKELIHQTLFCLQFLFSDRKIIFKNQYLYSAECFYRTTMRSENIRKKKTKLLIPEIQSL